MKYVEAAFNGGYGSYRCSVCGRDLSLSPVYMLKEDPKVGEYFCRDCAKRINAQKKEDEHGNR